MKTKSKLLSLVTFMLLLLGLVTIVNVSLNFRDFSINSAIDKSKMTAEIVKDGLTAHMVNGIMDKREYFLNKISNKDNIKSLWIVRSQNVIEQYGRGFNNETVRDAIDDRVLKSGLMAQEIVERPHEILLRVTIPYKAMITENPNCLTCHNVENGATLGAISMEFDISDMRNEGIMTILKIILFTFIFIIITLFLINYYISPYMRLFNNLQDGIKKAYRGNFTHKFETSIDGEAKEIVTKMNTLFGKIEETFGDIKKDLGTFVPHGSIPTDDPLYEAKKIIHELSDIYKFKKTIELDISKNVVYSRFTDVLKTKYNIKSFSLYELNHVSPKRVLIESTAESICLPEVDNNITLCRAYRTKSDVFSCEFENICKGCKFENIHYTCISYNINKEYSLVLTINCSSKEELDTINTQISNIKHYLQAAKPVIESSLLMNKLRDTSLRDGMTGLYNRRFLEEFIDKTMSQAQRDKKIYSILMLDIDLFKTVNDNYGHDVGDKVIVGLSRVLQTNIRKSDLAIRYGGEEFIVMLYNANEKGTVDVAKKIHAAFGKLQFDVNNGETMQKSISIGIAKFPSDGDTIWKCIKYADTALYVAKTTGRNKVVEYTPEMSQEEE